jgi:hypothetical protein
MRWLTVAPPGAQTAFALSLNDTPNVSFTTGCGISLITDDIERVLPRAARFVAE